MHRFIVRVAAALLVSAQLCIAAEEKRAELIVFAAASLTDVLQRISPEYTRSTGIPVKLSFAASSALARQIESGARAEVFFSADQEWMDYLDTRQLISRSSRRDLLGNRLALIAPRDSGASLKLQRGAPLLSALGESGRLATGDPDSVPVGKYAKSALAELDLWSAVEPRLVRAENVRVAMMYVARGEAPLGIVYATDAAVEPKVRIVDLFPESAHQPITYPIAAIHSASSAAAEYIDFLRGETARAIFERAGFRVLETKSSPKTTP